MYKLKLTCLFYECTTRLKHRVQTGVNRCVFWLGRGCKEGRKEGPNWNFSEVNRSRGATFAGTSRFKKRALKLREKYVENRAVEGLILEG